ncbi:MAG: SRPBCC family protein [Kiloniellales bacterium]
MSKTPKLHAERDPDYVYVIYIAASLEKVWAALTDNASERAWWAGTRHDSSFQEGDPIVYRRGGKVDVRGEILESDPSRRLVYSFHVEGPGPMHDEGPSIVTYELSRNGDATALKVIHGNFPRNSASRKGVEQGWPAILSGLKTVLEGGKVPAYAAWGQGERKAAG